MTFFCFDIETLAQDSNAVILSVGCVSVDSPKPPYYIKDLLKNGLFVKFDVKDQIQNYNRKIEKETVDWWSGQKQVAKDASLKVTPNDVDTLTGIKQIHEWFNSHKNKSEKDIIWSRGVFDQLIFGSLLKATNYENFVPFWKWRDVRTAVDIIYGDQSKNSYVNIDSRKCLDYFEESYQLVDHNPLHDATRDLLMIVAGDEFGDDIPF